MKLYKKIIISISLSLLCICGTITYNFNNQNNIVYADEYTPFTKTTFTTMFLAFLAGAGIYISNAGNNIISSFENWIDNKVQDIQTYTYFFKTGVGYVLDNKTSIKFQQLAQDYITENDLYDDTTKEIVISHNMMSNKIQQSSTYSNRSYALNIDYLNNRLIINAGGTNSSNLIGISNSSQFINIPYSVDILYNNTSNNITYRVNKTDNYNSNTNFIKPTYYKEFTTLSEAQNYVNSLQFRIQHGNSVYISNIAQRINDNNYNITDNWNNIIFNSNGTTGGTGYTLKAGFVYLILNCIYVKNVISQNYQSSLSIDYYTNMAQVTSGIDTYYNTANWSNYDVTTTTINNPTLDWQKYNSIVKTDKTDWSEFTQAISAALNGSGLVDQTNGIWDIAKNDEYENDSDIVLPYPDALDTDIDENTINTGGTIKFGILSLITQFLANILATLLKIPQYLHNIWEKIRSIDYTQIITDIKTLIGNIYNAITRTYTIEDIQAIEWITAIENFETTITSAINTMKTYYNNNINFFLTGIAHPTSNALTTMVNNVLTNSNLYWCIYAIVTYSLLRYFI